MHFRTHFYGFLPFPIGSYQHAKKTRTVPDPLGEPVRIQTEEMRRTPAWRQTFFFMLIHPNGREAGRGGVIGGAGILFKYWFTQRVLSTRS